MLILDIEICPHIVFKVLTLFINCFILRKLYFVLIYHISRYFVKIGIILILFVILLTNIGFYMYKWLTILKCKIKNIINHGHIYGHY